MVVRLIMLTLLGFLSSVSQTYASADFQVQLSKNTVEYGKSVNLIISSRTLQPSLKTIDLSVLNKDFFFSPNSELVKDKHQQQWIIRLFPRRTGKMIITALIFLESSSSIIHLNSTTAVDPNTGNILSLESSISTPTAWTNQQVLFRTTIATKNKYIVVEKDSSSLTTGQLLSLSTQKQHSHNLTRHITGWAYFPSESGRQSLDLPPILYKSDGVTTHMFYLPLQQITIKPLPLYVPDNFPIGVLSITADAAPLFFLSNTLQNIKIALNAQGISKQQLPRIQNYFRSQADLQLYPPTVSLEQSSGHSGLLSHATLEIPFKASSTGIYQLEDIRLQYFEPVSGRIQTLHYHWPRMIFINPWLLAFVIILLLLAFGYSTKMLYVYLNRIYNKQMTLKIARENLFNAKTPEQMKSAIMLMSQADNGIGNTTLQCWKENKQIDIEPLSQALYRKSSYVLAELKQTYLKL